MKIGIIQASSQIDKNELIFNSVVKNTEKLHHDVINFGCFQNETEIYSYIEIALEISLLLASHAIDFIVTGCSSGQGMMLACNSLPGVICGYASDPQDAFLFGRINDGNALSLPLGLNFGWAGEINLDCTIEKLFDTPFGSGYPVKDADRKKRDTLLLKQINATTKKNILEVFDQLDDGLIKKVLSRKNITEYILANGDNIEINDWIRCHTL